jgi:hypothetical protein
MRGRMRFVAAVLSLPLLAGLAACGEIQEAQQGAQQAQQQLEQAQRGLDTASACVQALNIANFVPNLGNLQQAQADAQAKAAEIGRLADQTADQTLKQNLMDVQTSVQRVASGEITPANSLAWTQAQLEKYQKVAQTCSG